MDSQCRFVVGTDGSDLSLAALVFAHREAALRGADLEVVLAWDFLDQPHFPDERPFDPDYDQAHAEKFLQTLLERMAAEPAPEKVVQRTICERPAPALLKVAEGADLVVVGARGAGGFLGLRLGSVSQQVITHATGPVAVVRGIEGSPGVVPGDPDGPVVVGVDGSDDSRRALRWAVAEAARRRVGVVALHAWMPPMVVAGPFFSAPIDTEAYSVTARQLIEHEVSRVKAEGITVPVEARAVLAGAAEALLEACRGASMVVVASRGRGGFSGLLLGSTSQQLAHHAECPVVILPPG